MSADLEKARQAVIDWAAIYIDNPADDFMAYVGLKKAVKSLKAIESKPRPSDGGRMTESSIGGET